MFPYVFFFFQDKMQFDPISFLFFLGGGVTIKPKLYLIQGIFDQFKAVQSHGKNQ